tara:strand:- start:29 stop:217 length:189 start_codon:yes stop_codon:yes gene_type:complete
MKVKAKASYKKLSRDKNYIAFDSTSKHLWLMDDREIEIKGDVPEALKEHLIEIKDTNEGGKK